MPLKETTPVVVPTRSRGNYSKKCPQKNNVEERTLLIVKTSLSFMALAACHSREKRQYSVKTAPEKEVDLTVLGSRQLLKKMCKTAGQTYEYYVCLGFV